MTPNRTPGYLHSTTWYQRWKTHVEFIDKLQLDTSTKKTLIMNMHTLVNNSGGYGSRNTAHVATLSLDLLFEEFKWTIPGAK